MLKYALFVHQSFSYWDVKSCRLWFATNKLREIGTSNTIIPNALIEFINTPTVVIANELGEFTIENIPPATYSIKVSVGNYDAKTVENIVVTANATTELDIKLTATE